MTRTRPKASPQRPKRRTSVSAAESDGAERQIKIGEAARLIGVEAYVLRFWETQFPFLRPRHSRSKHRYYDQKSIEVLQLIRRLLHSEGYTIAGAKKHIREGGLDRLRREVAAPAAAAIEAAPRNTGEARQATRGSELSRSLQTKLSAIREELRSLHKLVAG
jgi:DNA-binding transcriptional MerR regulator